MRLPRIAAFITVGLLAGLASCHYYLDHSFRQTYRDANALLHATSTSKPYLKAHLRNGEVYIFDNKWQYDTERKQLAGAARRYNFNRRELSNGAVTLPVDSVVLFETNKPIESRDNARIAAMSVLTAADVVLGTICVTVPKACFGSCPTFYFQNEENVNGANAEGFSSSISPAFEAGDVDALNNPSLATSDGTFALTMKNEALENHAVNTVQLLAAPRAAGQRVYHDGARHYYACGPAVVPTAARGNGRDVRTSLSQVGDQQEYFSPADSTDLSTREVVELTYTTADRGQQALVLNFRQTLMTTFLLYSAYAYMGDEVGDLLAQVETDKRVKEAITNPYQLLGGIEVLCWSEQQRRWLPASTLYETGPIAHNLQVVPLPAACAGQRQTRVRLRMAKGYWRLDYAGLAPLHGEVQPVALPPAQVTKQGVPDALALAELRTDDRQYLASLPGDAYRLYYRLPKAGQDYELFVYSKGYYLEWIRKDWLREKNLPKLRAMLQNDPATWRELAREFKQAEPQMEAIFWDSKIVL
jgi:hypothetical protein